MLNINFRWEQGCQPLKQHLESLVMAAMNAIYTESMDAMDAIQLQADDITYNVAKDGRTCLGGQIIYNLANNVELVIDTFLGHVTAKHGSELYQLEFDEDPAGFQMAVSDLFWAARS